MDNLRNNRGSITSPNVLSIWDLASNLVEKGVYRVNEVLERKNPVGEVYITKFLQDILDSSRQLELILQREILDSVNDRDQKNLEIWKYDIFLNDLNTSNRDFFCKVITWEQFELLQEIVSNLLIGFLCKFEISYDQLVNIISYLYKGKKDDEISLIIHNLLRKYLINNWNSTGWNTVKRSLIDNYLESREKIWMMLFDQLWIKKD